MKKKVAFVIPYLGGGGAERVITTILRNINKDLFELCLIVINKEGVYLNQIPPYVKIIDLNSTRVRYSLIRIIKAINLNRPDVIFSTLGHMNLALLMLRPLLKGKPRIIVREASTPSLSLSELSRSKRLLFKSLFKLFYPKSDVIIAQCNDMKKDIINNYNIKDNMIDFIYNPLEISLIKSKCKLFNPYENDKINLIAVGRLTYAKGFDILLEAFSEVCKYYPNVHLTILGEGELENTLKKQAIDLDIVDHVSFLGFVDNPYPYYYYSDTYILSSRWEGFPNTLLEALACGTKVVATNCKSGPNEIIGNNEYGILAEVSNIESLSTSIIRSINGSNKSNNRGEHFEVSKIIKEYEKILLKL